MALKVQFNKPGVILFKSIRENLHHVSLKDVEQVHGLETPQTSMDPPKDPQATLLVHTATIHGFWKVKHVLGLVACWLMNKHGPKGNQDKEPYRSCNMRNESIMSLKSDLDFDGAKLVDKLEQRHDEELDHKVSQMVANHNSHVGSPVLGQDNGSVVMCVDAVKEELGCQEEEEDGHILDQLCDPRMNPPVQWSAAYITLHDRDPLRTVLSVLVDLVFFPIKVAVIVLDMIVAWRFLLCKRCMF